MDLYQVFLVTEVILGVFSYSVEESENSKPDTEWLEKLLEQHSEDDYEDDVEDDDWFEPDYNTESFIFDEDADF